MISSVDMVILVQVLGWVGALFTLGAYALLTAGRLSTLHRSYQWLNIVGGACLMVNTAFFAVWPSAVVNLVWLGIGAGGLIQDRRRRAAERRAAESRADEETTAPITDLTSLVE